MKLRNIFLPIFLFVAFFIFPSLVLADTCLNPSDNPCWVAKSPMPTARRELGVTSGSNGKIYTVGGYDGHGGFLDTFEMYDPATDSWTTKTPMPTARNAMGFTRLNDKLYAIGGFNGSGTFPNAFFSETDEYNPVMNVWTTKASMPTARFSLGLATGLNGKLYAMGGATSDGLCINTVEEYDPTIDHWATKTPMPTARCALYAVTAPNGKIYAIGGHLDFRNNNINVTTVEEYDPVNDTWVTKAPMSIARSVLGASVNAIGNIYAVGGFVGEGGSFELTNAVEEYNPTTNTWVTRTSFPVAIHEFGLALAGDGNVYALGGQTQNNPAINTNYAGISSVDLNVPLLKQTAEPWQSHEYDSAALWSPSSPTINAWGCVVTSAAMVFQYHGIKKLPNDTILDPGTLNSWLKNQPDGYIRNGLVNWLSLSRLSRLAKSNNPSFSHDALEYRRKNGENKPQLTEDLQNGIPGILEEPGHFIVGKGISDATFLINDPFHSRTDLSSYSNTFQSLGRYVPSNTDLSYIMLVVNEEIDISVSSPSGALVGESFVQQPLDNDQNSGQDSGDPLKIFYLPKPENGEYEINVSAGSLSDYALDVYMYDQDGDVKKINFIGMVDPSDTDNYSINFNKNVTFDTLISDINFLRLTGEIKNFNTYVSLLAKANVADRIKNIKPAAKAILKSIQREVERQRGKALTENAYEILSNDISTLLSTL